MKFPAPSPTVSQRFFELLPEAPGVTRRLVFGCPCGFVAGQMFFGVFGSDLFVRLSEEDRPTALALRGAHAFEPMPGRPLREYVVLPPEVVADTRRMRRWLARSLAWSSARPPGAATKARRARPAARPRRR